MEDAKKADETPSYTDILLANCIQYLISSGNKELAASLLKCNLSLDYVDTAFMLDGSDQCVDVVNLWVEAPYQVYTELSGSPKFKTVEDTVHKVNNDSSTGIKEIGLRLQSLANLGPNWRKEFGELLNPEGGLNQGVQIKDGKLLTWNGMRFRSETERRIAEALDKRRITYLPNCIVRLSSGYVRMNSEPDFLVISGGKMGILHVDGPHHQGAAAEDHARDRVLKLNGISVVERFPAPECFENPMAVVDRFMQVLLRS